MAASDRYRITRSLGLGGMAEVFEATLQGPGGFTRKVAIKRLRADLAEDPALVEAFVNEARLLSQLHHANIISVLDFGLMDGLPFQVLELVDGLDLVGLAAAAERGEPSVAPELWLAVVAEAAHALEHAHQARDDQGRPLGIVHRDVSPGNILVSWSGDVKLGDFGIASSLAQRGQTKVGLALGKLEYMAPEQHLGSGVDPRTDVFGLGCVLHRMLVGRSPIAAVDARTKLLSGSRVAVNPALPADIAKIVQRAIEPERSRRQASAAQLASECTRLIARLSEDDGRTLLRNWLGRLRPKEERAPRSPLAELMNAELVLEQEEAPLRRYTSTLQRPTSVVAIGDELSPAGPTVHAAPKPEFADQFVTDPAPGVMSGEYEIFELLGTGGFARVYRAKHLPSGRELALKLLRTDTDAVASPTSTRRFAREAQALASLSHPNLVRIADSGLTPDGLPYLAMELVRGSTLLQALRDAGSFPLERARDLARQLAEGLAEVHARGYVHRDLKPKNVMLVPSEGGETVKILDFGLTRLLDPESELTRLTALGFQLGTARWMAPEQIRDPSNVGPAADLYALGLILYSMIAGRPPFAGSADEVLHQHLESPPPALPEAGPLAALVERLLAKDPAHRPESARAVASQLTAIDLGATQLEMRPTRGEFSVEVKTAKEETWAGEDDGEQLGTPTMPLRSARPSPAPPTIVPRSAHVAQVPLPRPGPPITRLSREVVIIGSSLLFSLALAVTMLVRGGRTELYSESVVQRVELPVEAPVISAAASPERPVPARPSATPQTEPVPERRGRPRPEPPRPEPPRPEPPRPEPPRPEPPRPEPRAQVQAKVSELGPSLAAALAERGLSMGDLELSPEARQASRQWKAALNGQDPAAVEAAHRALLREVSSFAVDPTTLATLLESAREAMSERALTEAGRVGLPELEKRYLDLRARASTAEGASALSLARQIRRLELELRAP